MVVPTICHGGASRKLCLPGFGSERGALGREIRETGLDRKPECREGLTMVVGHESFELERLGHGRWT